MAFEGGSAACVYCGAEILFGADAGAYAAVTRLREATRGLSRQETVGYRLGRAAAEIGEARAAAERLLARRMAA